MPRKLYAFVLSALFIFSTSTFAEVETTSSIRGEVNVSGAEVTVTHIPTGTTKTRTANEDGLFFVSDLLIGGPYEINASASGYQSQSQSGLYLVLNKTAAIEITLVSNNMEEIGVTASATSGTIRMGGGISLGEDAIAGVPTINRSIADFAKFDPRVSINSESSKNSSITVMGAHERFNDFSVDGVSFNDPFGLNDNGFGSMRNPISMEFVDQISVDITPYDVSRGNTTGGSIATVTKSGSNDFHGSVFFIERDEGDVGELFGQDFAEFSEETKGFTFSGPIIEDKLFKENNQTKNQPIKHNGTAKWAAQVSLQIESYTPLDNVSELTARTNDEGWDTIFSEWLKVSNFNSRDALFILSVGGGNLEKNISPNLVMALKLAKNINAKVLGIVGKDGGYTAKVSDTVLIIPIVNDNSITPHTESFQALVWHLIVSHPKLKINQTKWESA